MLFNYLKSLEIIRVKKRSQVGEQIFGLLWKVFCRLAQLGAGSEGAVLEDSCQAECRPSLRGAMASEHELLFGTGTVLPGVRGRYSCQSWAVQGPPSQRLYLSNY